jgi:VanZ family protein
MLHRNRLADTAALGFWLCLVGAVGLALLPHPPHFREFGDKAQHMLAFGTLALLGSFAFPAMPKVRLGERLSFLGALVEVAQAFPALHRDCDIRDWIADTVAIAAVLVALHLLRMPRKPA